MAGLKCHSGHFQSAMIFFFNLQQVYWYKLHKEEDGRKGL